MGGQFKSRLDCPECQNVSITFDPYLSISLPIPQHPDPYDFKKQDFYIVFADLERKSLKVENAIYNVKNGTIGDIVSGLGKTVNLEK